MNNKVFYIHRRGGGAVASTLARLTVDQVVGVLPLAGNIALCSWAVHFILTVPPSTLGWVVRKPFTPHAELKVNRNIGFSCIKLFFIAYVFL